METPDAGLDETIRSWINRCATVSNRSPEPPYLDCDFPELDQGLPFDITESKEHEITPLLHSLESHLAENPTSLPLRLAVLYPFKAAALASPYKLEYGVTEDSKRKFRYLVDLCAPEKLTSARDLKFELHCMYWAANWLKAEKILQRISLLAVLEPQQLLALRGHFWFLSVFGRRIEYELSNNGLDFYDFDWPFSLPFGLDKHQRLGFRRFGRPEVLQVSSAAHWALTAWCSNPRAPQPIPPPDPPLFTEQSLDDASMQPQDSDCATTLRERPIRHYVHHRYREFSPVKPLALTRNQKQRLRKAVEDLQQLARVDSALVVPYRPLLAHSLFALADHTAAATVFAQMLEDNVVFASSSDPQEAQEDYRWEIAFFAAWNYRLAGNFEGAVDMLERLSADARRVEGAAWWTAKWYSEEGKYEEASRYLRRELGLRFSPPESWQLSTILALEAIAGERAADGAAERFSEDLARKNPNLYSLLTGLIQEHWAEYANLLPDSRCHWLYAEAQLHGDCLMPEIRSASLNTAVRDFAWVLESELKRVFKEFRSSVHKEAKILAQVQKDYREDLKNPVLRFLQKEPDIGLGAMINAIKDCQHSCIQTDLNLFHWLNENCSGVFSAINMMEDVNELRNCATHENARFQTDVVLWMAMHCRTALTQILQKKSSNPAEQTRQ